MSAAAANLVDSNFFIRSLLLTLERVSAAGHDNSQEIQWTRGIGTRFYLSHSWWDTQAISLTCDKKTSENVGEDAYDSSRPSDWFPSNEIVQVNGTLSNESAILPSGLEESVGHFGWVFTPADAYHPNTLEHLSWFLAANQARLLRDLLGVVDLRNINHENICCLNTAVVVLIFAHRRKHLSALLRELQSKTIVKTLMAACRTQGRHRMMPERPPWNAPLATLASLPTSHLMAYRLRRLLLDRAPTAELKTCALLPPLPLGGR